MATRLRAVTARRVAALALAASLLHLSIPGAEAACARHPQSDRAAEHAQDHAREEHHPAAEREPTHESGAFGSDAREESCDTPGQTECCRALATCSLLFGANAKAASGAYAPRHDHVVGARTGIPLSRVAAPDPPPPRA